MMNRAFLELRDEHLEAMALALICNNIERDDYRRLCRWLQGALMASDCERDVTLDVLESLTGRVNFVQCTLLKIAFRKWAVMVHMYVLNEDGNMMHLTTNMVQGKPAF